MKRRLMSDSGLAPSVESVRLFPIPTTKDGVRINGTDMMISEGLRELSDGEAVIGYGIPDDITEKLTRAGVAVADSARDEIFLQANGELTALGAMGKLMTAGEKALCDMKIGIVGYGRIGSALCRLLLPVCSQLTVYTTRPEVRCQLGTYSVTSGLVGEWEGLDSLDALINTAPAPLLSEVARPEGVRVIDLASGNNLSFWEGVEKYPSIPAVMYPESAAEIWYQSVLRLI